MLIESIIVVAIAMGLVMWAYLRDFFATILIPALRTHVSDQVAEAVATLVSWVDSPASAVRKTARQSWQAFQHHVLGIRTRFKALDANRVEVTETSHLLNAERTEVTEHCRTRTIAFEDLPADVRRAMIQRGQRVVEVDMKDAFEQKVKKKLDLEVAA